ncbi:CobW family GTP-binding protein [Arsenicicoccus bolidensis]|uniref:GTP-binding protein n=1 Tax=Arsenicicoccus bolidensis TaxID=229480 RepID=A0ABS9Q229_9MICO|nr:GTP-binding protein [Arsenicicoccus bolidensis]MCG7321148.1 GTP-binding protein [Arsenicicoccus bolidensis]
MSARQARIPVIALSGSLGSGKTTLLNHLLRTGRGRIGVVINDFGDINVDAFLVSGHVDAAMSISGGCLCCLSDPTELDRALESLARPELDLDAIVVEASGLAEPRELARLIVSSEVRRVRFGGLVEIVDVAAWDEIGSYDESPVATDHLKVASLLVLNKVDRVAPDRVSLLENVIRELVGEKPMVPARLGQVDPDLLYDSLERPEPTGQLSLVDLLREEQQEHERLHHGREHDPGDAHGHEHAHHHWQSVSVDSPLPVDPGRLLDLLESRPAGLYRVKGVVWVDAPGHRQRWVVQAVGGWVAFERGPWPSGAERRTQLVAIGTGVDEAAVASDIRACLSDEGVLDPARVTPLLRYVVR